MFIYFNPAKLYTIWCIDLSGDLLYSDHLKFDANLGIGVSLVNTIEYEIPV